MVVSVKRRGCFELEDALTSLHPNGHQKSNGCHNNLKGRPGLGGFETLVPRERVTSRKWHKEGHPSFIVHDKSSVFENNRLVSCTFFLCGFVWMSSSKNPTFSEPRGAAARGLMPSFRELSVFGEHPCGCRAACSSCFKMHSLRL